MVNKPLVSLTSSIRAILQLNTHGIKLLNSQQYREAISLFSMSLTTVRQIATANANEQADLVLPAIETRMQNETMSSEGLDEKQFLFHTSIEITLGRKAEPSSFGIRRLSFALLFNLALAFHLHATSKKTSKKRLNKALAMYKLAHSMAEDAGVLGAIAIANNLGFAHSSLGNATKSRECFDQVISTVVMHTSSVGSCHGWLNRDLVDKILENAMRATFHPMIAAAAA